MSAKLTEEVWEYSQAKGIDKLVLLVIADNADTKTRVGYPGQKLIAARTGVSLRTVVTSIKQLVDDKEITIKKRRAKEGPKTYNTYTIREYVEPTSAAPARAPVAQEPRTQDIPPPSASPQSSGEGEAEHTPSNVFVAYFIDRVREMGGKVEARTEGKMQTFIKQVVDQGQFSDEEIKAGIDRVVLGSKSPSLLGEFVQEASMKAKPGTEAAAVEAKGEQNPRLEATQRRLAADDEYARHAMPKDEAGKLAKEQLERMGGGS